VLGGTYTYRKPRLRPKGVSYPGARLSSRMSAAIWTVLGVWAVTVLGMRFYLGAKIDALESRMDAGFARVEARLDAVDARGWTP